jgi:hypothetical protein
VAGVLLQAGKRAGQEGERRVAASQARCMGGAGCGQ